MALPAVIVLAKLGAVADKIALKSYFVGKMVALKAFLTSAIGAQAAQISVSMLAAGCAAMYWEKKVMGNGDERAVEAAVKKEMTYDIANQSLRWLVRQGII
jgi:hypothetical protein